MTPNNYYRQRAIERESKANAKLERELDRKVKLYFEQSLLKIEKDIAELYAKFGKENKLSPEEARRLIRGKEFRVWRMTLKEYIKAAKGNPEILKELNTLAMRSRISRVEALHARTLMEISDLSEKLNQFADATLYRGYVDSLYGNLYDIHKTSGLPSPPVAVDSEQVKRVLTTAWSGQTYDKRINLNNKKLSKALRNAVAQAVHRGESIQKLSKELTRKADVGYKDAQRLIQTELNYVQNQAAGQAIRDAEMGFYQFIAVLDHRTTPMCQSLDGEIFPIEEMNQGENAPPMHVRCRSTIAASEGEGRKISGRRVARDSEGKNIRIPAEMSYPDWKKVYIDKTMTLEQWRSLSNAAANGKIGNVI